MPHLSELTSPSPPPRAGKLQDRRQRGGRHRAATRPDFRRLSLRLLPPPDLLSLRLSATLPAKKRRRLMPAAVRMKKDLPGPPAFAPLGHPLASIPEIGKPSRTRDFRMLASGIGIHAYKADALPAELHRRVRSGRCGRGIPCPVPKLARIVPSPTSIAGRPARPGYGDSPSAGPAAPTAPPAPVPHPGPAALPARSDRSICWPGEQRLAGRIVRVP